MVYIGLLKNIPSSIGHYFQDKICTFFFIQPLIIMNIKNIVLLSSSMLSFHS